MTAKIHIFTKPDCRFCAQAKQVLDANGLAYEAHDIVADPQAGDLSIYLSGVAAVPQIFAGDIHINGATDLKALADCGQLPGLVARAGDADLSGEAADTVAAGAADLSLDSVIPESDGTKTDDPEQWPILHFYKDFFGFWPNCFYYMHHWPEAYKLFVYAHNVGAIGAGQKVLGRPVMMATGFATSNAHGCAYCQVHMTTAGGEAAFGIPALLEKARAGEFVEKSPVGPFELALAELAAHAALNQVTDGDFAEVTQTAPLARCSEAGVQANIMGTAMIASAFGYLNVFNDLTGVSVEPDWADQAATHAGIKAGRHGVSAERGQNNLDFDLPQGGPSLEQMVKDCDVRIEAAGGVEVVARTELGLVPAWMAAWQDDLRARHLLFYTELMQPRGHSGIGSDLKHLMARVSAIAKGHDYLAAVEGYMAYRQSVGTAVDLERIRHCFAAAKHDVRPDLFSERERAALRLAWLSAQVPLTTPKRFIQPAIDQFDAKELVHLISVCALASLVQRFSAIMRPEMEPEVRAFIDENGLVTDTLAQRYPEAGGRA